MKQTILICLLTLGFMSGCTLKHEVVPGPEPIAFDINININQEIRVRLDKEVEDLISDNPDLF